MNNTVRSVVAAVVGGVAVAVMVPATPARTQDRGAPVLVTNTPADPVPTTLQNDSRAPLFVSPSEHATFNVCPVSCGAYQVDAEKLGGSAATVDLDVPAGMRFMIRYVSVQAIRDGLGGIRVHLRTSFSGPNGMASQSVFLPIEFQAITFNGRRHFHGSFPVHVHHDSVVGGTGLSALAEAFGGDPEVRVRVLASGNLEPLPGQ